MKTFFMRYKWLIAIFAIFFLIVNLKMWLTGLIVGAVIGLLISLVCEFVRLIIIRVNMSPEEKQRQQALTKEKMANIKREHEKKMASIKSQQQEEKQRQQALVEEKKREKARLKAERKAKRKETLAQIQADVERQAKEKEQIKNSLICPKCHSDNIQVLGAQRKGFSVGKAVGGAILTGGIGALAGFAGKKGKKTEFVCMNCGNRFLK